MHREEAQEAPRVPVGILKPQQRQLLVLVILVLRPLLFRVRKICTRRPVDVRIQNRRVPYAQLAWSQIVVCPLDGENGPCDDRVGRLLDVPEGSELREQVFQVPAYAAVLVRRRKRDVLVGVQAGELRGELRHDGAADACVAHSDVWRIYSVLSGINAVNMTRRTGVDEHDATRRICSVCDDPRATALTHMQTGVRLREIGITLEQSTLNCRARGTRLTIRELTIMLVSTTGLEN